MILHRLFIGGVGTGLLLAVLLQGMGTFLSGGGIQPGTASEQTLQQRKEEAAKEGLVLLSQKEWQDQLTQAKAAGKQAGAQTVAVYILPGMSVSDIARLLVAAGVLPEGNAFIRLAQKENAPLIRSGVFLLPRNGQAQDVLKTLTTPSDGGR